MNTNQFPSDAVYAGHQIANAFKIVLNRPKVGDKYTYDINPCTKLPYTLTVVRVTEKRVSLQWDTSRKISVCKFEFLEKCSPLK